jgi:hypothetical protein
MSKAEILQWGLQITGFQGYGKKCQHRNIWTLTKLLGREVVL